MSYSTRHIEHRLHGMILLIIGFCTIVSSIWAADPSPAPMPEEVFPALQEILKGALEQSPTMVYKNIELAQSEANRMTAFAQLLPSVGTSISYNASNAAVSSNTDVKSRSVGLFYSASLNQPIFRWGTLKAAADAAKIQLHINQRNFAEAYRQLAQTIRNQYLGLVAKKSTWENAQSVRERTAYTLSLEEAKLKYGQIAPSAIFFPRLEMEEASLRADRAEEDYTMAKRYFSRLTGLPEPTDESIPSKIPSVRFDPSASANMLQAFMADGWENTAIIQSAKDWVKVAELNYKQAKYRLYPMVGFGASISQSNSTSASESTVSQVGVLSQSVGITASWTIFDGRATRAAKISARANQRYYERLLKTQSDTVIDEVRALEKQVGFAHRAMTLAEIRSNQADTAVAQRRDELNQGLASQVAVDAALATQDNYQVYLVNQRLDFLSRWSEFVSKVGADPVLQYLPASLKSNVR